MMNNSTGVECEHREKKTALLKLPRKRPNLKERWIRFLNFMKELDDSTIGITSADHHPLQKSCVYFLVHVFWGVD